ncbi:hypothetical protein ACIOHS_48925, partial [Streptomyces sp. NPDC088253]|uniref:hypothetical protein n=1 Tax=Streptomyces sp. NPDC088253 TaxID=3365846 RepID=UPI0038066CFD
SMAAGPSPAASGLPRRCMITNRTSCDYAEALGQWVSCDIEVGPIATEVGLVAFCDSENGSPQVERASQHHFDQVGAAPVKAGLA